MNDEAPVKRILIDGEYEEESLSEEDDIELKICQDVQLLVVEGENLNVWVNGTHYVGVGEANIVEEGDIFYYPQLEPDMISVIEVDEIIDPSPSDTPMAKIEFIYPPDRSTSELSKDALTGDLGARAERGLPPTILTHTGYTIIDTRRRHRGRTE